jgi:hypothetical protein
MDGLKAFSITIAMFMSIAIVIAATTLIVGGGNGGTTGHCSLGDYYVPIQCQTGIDK